MLERSKNNNYDIEKKINSWYSKFSSKFTNTTALTVWNSETEFNINLALPKKGLNNYKTTLDFEINNVLCGNNGTTQNLESGKELLFLSNTPCITACRVTTDNGEEIFNMTHARSYGRTVMERCKTQDQFKYINCPIKTQALDVNTVYTNGVYPTINDGALNYNSAVAGAANSAIRKNLKISTFNNVKSILQVTYNAAAPPVLNSVSPIIEGFWNGDIKEEQKRNKYDDDIYNAENILDGSGIAPITTLKYSVRLGDILGGFFDIDKDILFTSESLNFSFRIDNKFLVVRDKFPEGVTVNAFNPNFNIVSAQLNCFFQEDYNLNMYLLNWIKNQGVIIPYEYIRSQQFATNYAASGTITLSDKIYINDGDMLRKIYLQSFDAGWSVEKTELGQSRFENLNRVNVNINNTFVGDYNNDFFDFYKNTRIRSYPSHLYEHNWFLTIPFYNVNDDDEKIANNKFIVSGLPLDSSSSYYFTITKNLAANSLITTVQRASALSYIVHLVSLKYLVITGGAVKVANSLNQAELMLNKTNVIMTPNI